MLAKTPVSSNLDFGFVGASSSTSEPEGEEAACGEPSSPATAAVELDNVFNFQIVVFKVQNTIFEVLKAGFNVPGTIFETLFTLPQGASDGADGTSVEGSNRDHPIVLEGVKSSDFRIFLRILYPFMVQSEVSEYDEWISVLHLATMWDFKKIRATAINRLQSDFFPQKGAAEKISVGRKYRVVDWVKDGYKTLCQDPPTFSILTDRPNEPLGLDWETIAKFYMVREKLRKDNTSNQRCGTCNVYWGPSYHPNFACACQYMPVIEEVFKAELSAMNEVDASLAAPAITHKGKAGMKGGKGKGRRI
ncbi:hypothetical protein D9613_001082 [Agrocybe pediades]|uniref:BTB domain-containing protein n=1 Tax=Agrocybe pediades TaxID=84607 RepID=A0A8H4VRM9_9AGAR|nr:hypothetical protein D9613_001082 [Agrocybe pediades]